MPRRLRALFAIVFAVIGLAAVQAVFLLLEERRGDAVRRDFENVIDDTKLRGTRIDPNLLNARLSEMIRFGLIRCYQVVETAPALPPNFPASDCENTIDTQVSGEKDQELWAIRFEVLQPQELEILLWGMRALVVVTAVSFYLRPRFSR